MSLSKSEFQSFPESSFKTSEELKALVSKYGLTANNNRHSSLHSTYHVLSCLCILANITIAGWMFVGQDLTSLEHLRGKATTALSANFCACIAIRNEHVINMLVRIACSLPHRTPLRIRTSAARIYCHGGVHSGCAISGAIWYLVSTCLCLLASPGASRTRPALSFVSGITMLLLMAILIFAHPSLRARHHNVFELTHRLLGWMFVGTLWLQVILTNIAKSAESAKISGQHLLMDASFWLLVVSTALLIYPWTQLRLVSVEANILSEHVVCLTVHHKNEAPCVTRRLATMPLKETHAFATIPGKDGTSYSMYISAAGDWTQGLIGNPPKRIWVKGRPTYGATYSSGLFRKVLFVATGSGIAPVLSAVLARGVSEVVVFWMTSRPRGQLDDEQLQELEAYRDHVIIHNQSRHNITSADLSLIHI